MTVQVPIPDFAAARQAMVDNQLRPQGVSDPVVVEAMRAVPRERFVPDEWKALAYMDRMIPIGAGRHLSPPSSLGLLLTALQPRRGQNALVVGAGSGYSAAVLRKTGAAVTALEVDSGLAAAAKRQRIGVVEGSLEDGYQAKAPYDLILIDGAVDDVPEAIVDQLKDGGRLGVALNDRGITRLMVGIKAQGGIGYHSIADSAVAALPGFKRPRAFTF